MSEKQAVMVQNWQFAVLRFAITQDHRDRDLVFDHARELDRTGSGGKRQTFAFFSRTSEDVCMSILARHQFGRLDASLRYAALIEDPRLRRAFRAALESDCKSTAPRAIAKPKRADMWRGLRRR